MSQNHYPGVDPYAVRTVRCAARRMVRQPNLNPQELEDLEQELMLHLFTRLERFDPRRAGQKTFIARVVEAKVGEILKGRRFLKRWDDTFTRHFGPSLEQEQEEETESGLAAPLWAGIEGGVILATDETDAHLQALDFRLDVDRVMETLPEPLQAICKRLWTDSLTEIGADEGLTRSAMSWCLACIRRAFEEKGMGAYFQHFQKPNVQNGDSLSK